MTTKYTTTVINTGGRSGEVYSPDKSFSLKIAPPGNEKTDATNPEQLFAAGFSACFNSALSLVMLRQGIKAASTITATVSLYEREPFDYIIGMEIEGQIDGLSQEQTEDLLKQAEKVCPYSKATAGNIEVKVKAK